MRHVYCKNFNEICSATMTFINIIVHDNSNFLYEYDENGQEKI